MQAETEKFQHDLNGDAIVSAYKDRYMQQAGHDGHHGPRR